MPTHHPADDFCDPVAERSFLAALSLDQDVAREHLATLDAACFSAEPEMFAAVVASIDAGRAFAVPAEWQPATDLAAAFAHLRDLRTRRLVATCLHDLGQRLYAEAERVPADDLVASLDETTRWLQSALAPATLADSTSTADLLGRLCADLAARRARYEATGQPQMGLPTGLKKLDEKLDGLNPGLVLLGGGPGLGKTTLATQIATRVAAAAPVIYVTFENSPQNLLLKTVAANANLSAQQLQRGTADLAKFNRAAEALAPALQRLDIIAGASRTTLDDVRQRARAALRRHKADRCLVVVDYLQTWAKVAAEFDGRATARERVEALGGGLREMAVDLDSPVLALVSLNRSQGAYGGEEGRATLDSLKESGDLEYGADVVLLLNNTNKRTSSPAGHPVDLAIAKNRQGPTGTVALNFRPAQGHFAEVAA